jgi:transposase-like protein
MGEDARGLSGNVVSRLKAQWAEEHVAWSKRDLSKSRYVYWWVDGIHTGLRSENSDGQCLLVIIGVRPDGSKERVAIGDGYRETKASWLELLLDLKARGLQGGPLLAVGAGHRADHRAREARPRYATLLAQRTNRRRPACRAVRSRLQPALAAARHRPAGHQACSFRFSSGGSDGA